MSEELTEFELRVLRVFCELNDLPVPNMRDQLDRLSVRKREETGVGIYINFENSSKSACDISTTITGVSAGTDEENPELCFVLYFKDGLIRLLEGVSYLGDWPQDLSSYQAFADGLG